MSSVATPNRFLVGFYPGDEKVQNITEQAVDATKGNLSAVMVFNESNTLGEKFALMAVKENEHLELLKNQFSDKLICTELPTEWDEKDILFKHRAYLLLALTGSEGKLTLTKQSIDFLLKDVTGGVHIETAVCKIMSEEKLPALESLLGVVNSLIPNSPIKSIIVDVEHITDALRFCDIRRQVAERKKEQQKQSKSGATAK